MQKAIMEPFARLIRPQTLSFLTRVVSSQAEKAMNLLEKVQEQQVSKFKQDEMRSLDDVSGLKSAPRLFVGLVGNEELQQSWKQRVFSDWLKKEQIAIDAATGKDGAKDSKDTKTKKPEGDKKADGKKKKNKEDTTTTSSADDAQHKDTSKKKNDSQVGNKDQSGAAKKKKNKEDTTTTSSADDAKHKDTSKKKNDSQGGNKGAKVSKISSDHKGASGTQDEGPLSKLGVKNFESPDSNKKNTKEHAKDGGSGSGSKQGVDHEGRIGTRQTDQAKKGLGLDTGKDSNRDKFATGDAGKKSSEKNRSDHPLGLQQGVSPDEQTSKGPSPDEQASKGAKHPNKVGTQKGDLRQPTNESGKSGESRRPVGNHGVDIGKGQSADHRVNHAEQQEKNKKGSK